MPPERKTLGVPIYSELEFASEPSVPRLPYELWLRDVLREGMKYFTGKDWRSTTKTWEPNPEECDILYRHWSAEKRESSFAGKFKQTLFHLSLKSGRANVYIAGHDPKDCNETVGYLSEQIPETKPQEGFVPVTIWSGNDHASSIEKMLEVPHWEDIKANYPPETAEALDKLAHWDSFPNRGKLLIWHGDPGTGKTFALRALANQWQKWCDFHYIYDPETLFGTDKSYMFKVALGAGESVLPFEDILDKLDRYDEEDHDVVKSRLVILEDVGELITIDAKQSVGQALARLLNMSDGILGQGLRTYFLITANEELGKLHPAITRPGRCLANIKFDTLNYEQALEWARAQNVELPEKRKWTIADLYGLKDGNTVFSDQKLTPGFIH